MDAIGSNNINTITDDIYVFTNKYVDLVKRDMTIYGIRDYVRTVWIDKTEPKQIEHEMDVYKTSAVIPGIRLKGDHTKGIYTLCSALQMAYFDIIKSHNASKEGATMIMQEKRENAFNRVQEFNNKLNNEFYSRLKKLDYRFYCKLLLFCRSICELEVVVPNMGDYIIPSQHQQLKLAEMLKQYIDYAYQDMEIFRYILKNVYRLDSEDVFDDLKEMLYKVQCSLPRLMEGILRDKQIEDNIIDELKVKIADKIKNLHENNEFPVLVCKMFEKKGYYDIALTQDTRDGGCDIWATRDVKCKEGNKINQKLLISVKRYGDNISANAIKDFKSDIERYDREDRENIVPIMVTSSDFSRNAATLMNECKIEFINRSDIIEFLITHKLGVTHNLTIDNDFWEKLSQDKVRYRDGCLSKYPSPKQRYVSA